MACLKYTLGTERIQNRCHEKVRDHYSHASDFLVGRNGQRMVEEEWMGEEEEEEWMGEEEEEWKDEVDRSLRCAALLLDESRLPQWQQGPHDQGWTRR